MLPLPSPWSRVTIGRSGRSPPASSSQLHVSPEKYRPSRSDGAALDFAFDMCGITGLIETRQTCAEHLRSVAEAMAATLTHRGPDDAGVWLDAAAGIAFGFRRLAILDLSEAGHQPMVSHDGDLVVVFNGEIYNHAELRAAVSKSVQIPWRGHSDTETLLACFSAWGIVETLQRTVGMFSLALWNRRERRLYLARDRFGEKPLYFGWTRNAFVFGSELKSLRKYPGFDNEIDRNVVGLYLQHLCVPAPYSIFRNIYKLEPACVLSAPLADLACVLTGPPFAPVRRGALTIEPYWSAADVARRGVASPLEDERAALDQLETVLTDAVRLQSIADVPLGAFLSGGIDSSMIAALMQAQSGSRVKTFTIGFEEAGFNEAGYARAVAAHLGTDHTELYVSPQEARAVIPRLADLYSEPFADSSQIPTHLVARVARQHVTVALSGDGGDELFGGYIRYVWGGRIWRSLRSVPPSLQHTLFATIQGVPVRVWDRIGASLPRRYRISRLGDKAHKLACRGTPIRHLRDMYSLLSTTTWVADASVVRHAEPLPVWPRGIVETDLGEDAEHRMMLWDLVRYLPDDILHKVDRASMGVSLETRAPFLDHRVAELAWRLPLHLKIRGSSGKWIIRQLLYRYVPPRLIERPKMGFSMPVENWLRGPLRDWTEDLLSESTLNAQGYLNPAPIRQKWAEHLAGVRNWRDELWSVLMFQAWLSGKL